MNVETAVALLLVSGVVFFEALVLWRVRQNVSRVYKCPVCGVLAPKLVLDFWIKKYVCEVCVDNLCLGDYKW